LVAPKTAPPESDPASGLGVSIPPAKTPDWLSFAWLFAIFMRFFERLAKIRRHHLFAFHSCRPLTITLRKTSVPSRENRMAERAALALIAHDQKKDEMVAFARDHAERLANFQLYATGTTGQRIIDAVPGLALKRLKSGPVGGDQQVGALIAEGVVVALFFFIDALSPLPHDVDVKALTRLAVVYDIPMALNRRTAEILIRHRTFIETGRG
jgi:methylglyoxal synthase